MVMVEVHMHSSENPPLVVMLDLCQFSCQVSHMMVVNEGNGPDRFLVLIPLMPDQIVSNQIAEGF